MTMYLNTQPVCSSDAVYGGFEGGIELGVSNSTVKYAFPGVQVLGYLVLT
jgi:hypothetical protein